MANSDAEAFLFVPTNKRAVACKLLKRFGVPDGIRTRVIAVKALGPIVSY
jgi:hypothetical protein